MSGANGGADGRAIPPEAGAATIYGADIQQLNLQRTDLVVLSACRSGLGDIEVETATTLRRAFRRRRPKHRQRAVDVPEDSPSS